LITIQTLALQGIDSYEIAVEVDVSPGMLVYAVVGLPDAAVKESRERIKAAIENIGYRLPERHIVVNLAPADLRKEGSSYDLPMALGIMIDSGQCELARKGYAILGELSLEGKVRPIRGALSRAMAAKKTGAKGLILPRENAPEAALVDELEIIPVDTLNDALDFLTGSFDITPLTINRDELFHDSATYLVDMTEVAAAGGHNIVMVGPPGSGKTMLAQRLPTILPTLTFPEAIEVTRIHSSAGLLPPGQALIATRPFRTIHHSISSAGLAGGGTSPHPGEISLAHNGVLFLDELPEFRRDVLEVLRQPMEDGAITISRASGSLRFPSRFMLAAAANPCPCGYLGDTRRRCHCTPLMVKRYLDRVSGPLLDRIDLHVEVPAVKAEDLKGIPQGETSAVVKARVEMARRIQQERLGEDGVYCNAAMATRHVHRFCQINDAATDLISKAITRLGLSARAHDRVLKVARTIADLEGEKDIQTQHVAEAISYRVLDRYWE
jgi:magnesium chelatase family protein